MIAFMAAMAALDFTGALRQLAKISLAAGRTWYARWLVRVILHVIPHTRVATVLTGCRQTTFPAAAGHIALWARLVTSLAVVSWEA